MKSCLSSLVPLAILGAIVAIALGPGFIAAGVFGVSEKGAVAIGACSLGLTLYGLYRWIIYHQDKENEVMSVLADPVFGEVRQLRDHWEATLPIADGGESVEIWGDSLSPTPAQTSTFLKIRERWPALLGVSLEAANNLIASAYTTRGKFVPLIKAEQLVFESLSLDGGGVGDFTLMFDVVSEAKVLPWGVNVMFEKFAVVEASDNH